MPLIHVPGHASSRFRGVAPFITAPPTKYPRTSRTTLSCPGQKDLACSRTANFNLLQFLHYHVKFMYRWYELHRGTVTFCLYVPCANRDSLAWFFFYSLLQREVLRREPAGRLGYQLDGLPRRRAARHRRLRHGDPSVSAPRGRRRRRRSRAPLSLPMYVGV